MGGQLHPCGLKIGIFSLLIGMRLMHSFMQQAWVGFLLYLRLLLPRSRLPHPLLQTALLAISHSSFQELRSADIVPPSTLPICWQEESAHRFRSLSGTVSSISSIAGVFRRYLYLVRHGTMCAFLG